MTPWTREEAETLLTEVEEAWASLTEEQRQQMRDRLSVEAPVEPDRRPIPSSIDDQ